MSKRKNTTEQNKRIFLEALRKSLNIVSSACEVTGIGRTTFYEWCKTDPVFKQKVDEVPDLQFDFVEAQLLKRIKEGSDTAITFYLKTKGRKKGYNEKIEIEGNLNHNIQIIKLDGPKENGVED